MHGVRIPSFGIAIGILLGVMVFVYGVVGIAVDFVVAGVGVVDTTAVGLGENCDYWVVGADDDPIRSRNCSKSDGLSCEPCWSGCNATV